MRKRKNQSQDHYRSGNSNDQTNQSTFSASSFPIQQSTNQNWSSSHKLQRQISNRNSNFGNISLTAGELDKSRGIAIQPTINPRGIQLPREHQNIDRQQNPSPMVRSMRENMIQKQNDSLNRQISSPNQLIQRVLTDIETGNRYSESSPKMEEQYKFTSEDDAFITLVRDKSKIAHYMVYIETADRKGAIFTDLFPDNKILIFATYSVIRFEELSPGEAGVRMASKSAEYKQTWRVNNKRAKNAIEKAQQLEKEAKENKLGYTATGRNWKFWNNKLQTKKNDYNCVKYTEQILEAANILQPITTEKNGSYKYEGRTSPEKLDSQDKYLKQHKYRDKPLAHHGQLKPISGQKNTTLPDWTHNQSKFLDQIRKASPKNKNFKKSEELKSIGDTFAKYHRNIFIELKIKNLEKIYAQTIKYISRKSNQKKNKLLEHGRIKFMADTFPSVILKELSELIANLGKKENSLESQERQLKQLKDVKDGSNQQESEKLKSITRRKNFIGQLLSDTVIPLNYKFVYLSQAGKNESSLKKSIKERKKEANRAKAKPLKSNN